jgi:PAS domain S-box-containing protein
VNAGFQRTLGYPTHQLTSRPVFDFVHPEDHERTRAALGVLAAGGALHEFENRYICRDGSSRWLQWNCQPGPTKGLVAAAARDVTDSLARREQAALRRVATVVAHGGEPTEVLNAVADEVACLLEADLTLIGRYEPDATFTYLVVGGRLPTSELRDRLTLGGNNLASNILQCGQSQSMSYDTASGPIAAFAHMLGIRNAVGTPITVDDRIWGAMLAGWTHPRELTSETVDHIAEITELHGPAAYKSFKCGGAPANYHCPRAVPRSTEQALLSGLGSLLSSAPPVARTTLPSFDLTAAGHHERHT